MYTPQMMARRLALMTQPEVVDAINTFWYTFSKTSGDSPNNPATSNHNLVSVDNCIKRSEYISVHVKMSKALLGDHFDLDRREFTT